MVVLYETDTIEFKDVNVCYVVRQYPSGYYYTNEVHINKVGVKTADFIRHYGLLTFDEAIDDARERYCERMDGRS